MKKSNSEPCWNLLFFCFRLIKTINVKNFTRPESIVSTSDNMYVLFTAEKNIVTEIFLEITAGLEKTPDLNVTDTLVADNSGRGVWIEQMRSNVHIHHSQIKRNNHIAGNNVIIIEKLHSKYLEKNDKFKIP